MSEAPTSNGADYHGERLPLTIEVGVIIYKLALLVGVIAAIPLLIVTLVTREERGLLRPARELEENHPISH